MMKRKFLTLGLMLITPGCGTPSKSNSVLNASLPDHVLQNTQLWEIQTPGGLNCRTGPGTQHGIVYDALAKGGYLQSEGEIKRDRNGESWLKVLPLEAYVDHTPCYVKADPDFMRPFTTHLGDTGEIEGDVTCPITVRHSALETFVETKDFRIYVCSLQDTLYYLAYDRNSRDARPSLVLNGKRADVQSIDGYLFKNGSYEYSISLPTPPSGVSLLSVYNYEREFPTLLRQPAVRYLVADVIDAFD